MAEALIDIKIFPNKEMSSVDMAEMLDATIPNNSIIQGCELTLMNGVFNISSGRLVVGGRLGVVTGGTIPNPTSLTATTICYPLAVCDLSDSERPFYFLIATPDDLNRLNLNTEERNPTFNINNGTDALVFGYCSVDPATGLASDYHALSGATAKKGWDWWGDLLARVDLLEEQRTWKLVENKDYKATDANPWVVIPTGAKEVFVSVFIDWTSSQKVCVDFHIPVAPHMFNPYPESAMTSHVNYWCAGYNGFVRILTMTRDGVYALRLSEAYNKETNVLNSTYYRVYYR